MMQRRFLRLMFILFSFSALATVAAHESLRPIIWKTDPPIVVDGDFSDWDGIGIPHPVTTFKYQNSRSLRKYQGAADCSGEIKFAWRPQGLFLMARVRDSEFVQQYTGAEMMKGDHLEIFLDLLPGINPAQKNFGPGQYQFGISPGDFKSIEPEIHLWLPAGTPPPSHQAAAVRTETGWAVEAFIAWARPMHRYSRLGMEVWISDTDREAPDIQKQIVSLGNPSWVFGNRTAMQQWILADTDGTVPEAEKNRSLAGTELGALKVPVLKEVEKNVELPPVPAGTIPVLYFKGRLDTYLPYGGYTTTMKIWVNGKELNAGHLLNRPDVIRHFSGKEAAVHDARNGFLLPYSKNFLTLSEWQSKFKTRVSLHDFELNLKGFCRPGKNTIRFRNCSKLRPVYLENMKITCQTPPAEKKFRPAPTGKLPRFSPWKVRPADFAMEQKKDILVITLRKEKYHLQSRFSAPDGKWYTGSNPFFRHVRRMERRSEALIITDEFTNLTKEILPLRQRHEITIVQPAAPIRFFLNGLEAYPSAAKVSSFNFTTFGATEKGGIGLLPVNDVFQIHAKNYISPEKRLGLCDEEFALKPGQARSQTFAVIPVDRPDYWHFINAARRLLDANFTIQGPFSGRAIVCHWKWTDQAHRDYIRTRAGDCPYLIINTYAAGNLFDGKTRIKIHRAVDRYRKVFPDKKLLMYFHDQMGSFDEIRPPQPGLAPCLTGQNGQPAFYSGSRHKRLFLPLPGSKMAAWDKEKLRIFLDDFKMDGVFWDEYAFSALRYHYADPWDGVSCDIDPATGRLRRLKSAVPLLKEDFHKEILTDLKKRGKFFCSNGAVYGIGRVMKMQSMCESEVRTNLPKMHLYSPCQYQRYMVPGMVYSDHYLDMIDGLQRGLLFLWSGSIDPKKNKVPEYPTLAEKMFPFTPLELHAGYLFGEERIVSCVSGTFGWDDASPHQVFVYDNFGMRVNRPAIRTFRENGRTWTDLRLAENYSAVIVRGKKK